MIKRARNNFITGIAIIFPIAITIIIIRFLVLKVNSYILNPLIQLLNLHPYLTKYSVYIAKFTVFILVVLFISFVGWAANIIFLRNIFGFWEKIFIKVPMVGKIYSVSKEIGLAVLGEGKAFFKEVALVEYPRKGVYSIGFTTGKTQGEIKDTTGRELVGLFIPTAPNPTSGMFLLVPKEEVIFSNMTVEDGMKVVVSGGTIMPEDILKISDKPR